MRIGILLPSIFTANQYLKGRIFAPLYPALDLANNLVDRGHEVFFYCSKDVKTKAQIIGGDEELIKKTPFYYLFRNREALEQKYSAIEIMKRDFEYDLTLKAYDDAINKKSLDIIHSYHDFGAHYFDELTKFPTAYTLHDPMPKTKDTVEYFRLSKFKHHNYVSISNFQRNGIMKINFVATVYHGLKLENFEFDNDPENQLIYFGRVLEDKGTDTAVEVALKMGIPLHIATSTIRANRNEDFYEKKITPFIDGKKVILAGFMDGKNRSDFIKKGKAFIFPLRWDEPFGLTMIEAMACGTPVIAYNRGSVPEIVRDGLTGFIVDPDDEDRPGKGGWVIKKQGIEGLVEAVKRIGEIDRKACRKHVEENFTVEKMTDGYEKVYTEIISREKNG